MILGFMRHLRDQVFTRIHCFVIFLFPLLCWSQAASDRVGSGVASEWQTQIVSEAIGLDQLFGTPQNLTRVRKPRLWQPAKEKPNKAIDGKNLFRISQFEAA